MMSERERFLNGNLLRDIPDKVRGALYAVAMLGCAGIEAAFPPDSPEDAEIRSERFNITVEAPVQTEEDLLK